MTDLPMTTFGGDGKAPKRRHNLPMTNETNVEDVEQLKNDDTEKGGDTKGILGDIEAEFKELSEMAEDLPPLPTEEEAELGELCRVRRTQFDDCELVDDETPDLIGAITEGDGRSEATDEEVRRAVESFEGGDN